jgi:hypothetical protein
MPLTCREAVERLSECNAPVRAHLADCGDCRRYVLSYLLTVAMVKEAFPRVAPTPAGFVDRVMRSLRQEQLV